jgi:hypothetical protein
MIIIIFFWFVGIIMALTLREIPDAFIFKKRFKKQN